MKKTNKNVQMGISLGMCFGVAIGTSIGHVDMTDNSKKRVNGTECILCMECVKACPKQAL